MRVGAKCGHPGIPELNKQGTNVLLNFIIILLLDWSISLTSLPTILENCIRCIRKKLCCFIYLVGPYPIWAHVVGLWP
jgi:hypothetical protein